MTGDFGVCKFRRLLFVSCAGLATTNLIDLTDVIIAGNVLGETALTVTNLFWPCIDFEFFVCTAVAAGTAILHSRAVGEFNARRASDLFSNGLILSALTGLILSIGMWFLQGSAVAFYGVTGESLGYLMDYWRVFVIEIAIFPVYVYLNTMIVSDGDSLVSAFSFTTELCVNAVASYFLCRAYGMSGCALGSVISTLAGISVACVHFLRKTNSLSFRWWFSLRDSWAAFVTDLPEASVSLFTAITYAVMNKMLIVWFGEDILPVVAAVVTTNGFILFLYGVAPAAQPIVNVYLAEGNFWSVRRVMRAALVTSFSLGALTGLVLAIFPGVVVRLIGITSPEIAVAAGFAIRAVAYACPFFALSLLFSAYYLYINRAMLSVSLVALQSLVLPVLLCIVGAWFGGRNGFWLGYAAASPLAVGIFFGVLKLIFRDKIETPPWFLDLSRDAYAFAWTLRTDPQAICDVSKSVLTKLETGGASPTTLAKASLLVEDTLMAIRERNDGRAVLAEVQLDIRPTDASDGRFVARLLLRDDGIVADADDENGRPEAAAFRDEVLSRVQQTLGSCRSRVTTGFNRREFAL